MANLFPCTTGLPMTVWVSPRGIARHGATVEVSGTHGEEMLPPTNASVVGVRPWPHIITDHLAPADEEAAFRWISLNTAALVSYWEGQIDTAELSRRLKKLA
jgi:hypothetical protein